MNDTPTRHPADEPPAWCQDCRNFVDVEDVSDEQVRERSGFRNLHVTRLVCGHTVTSDRGLTRYPVTATGEVIPS